MHSKDAADTYRQASIENAPPVKIVRLLYEGAVRALDRAQHADPSKSSSGFIQSLAKADAIVSELRASLDHAAGPEISRELDRLYVFVQDRIAKAITGRQREPIGEARTVLAKLLDGWKAIEIDAPPESS